MLPFDVVNKLMTKKEISAMIDAVYRHCGQKESVIFCDRIMALGFYNAFKAGISFGKDDMVVPENKWEIVEETRALAKDYEQQYQDGLITQGEKYNKVVDAWAKCSDRLAGEMMDRISSVKKDENGRDKPVNSIYMMSPLGRARFAGADEAARGDARPDGQAVGRDHREPDHLELQGRPRRARVLQLDARRPQGPRRHGAQDGELGLPDPPPRRRGAGRGHPRAGLRHRAAASACAPSSTPARSSRRWRRASSAAPRPRTSSRLDGTIIVPKGTMIEEEHIEAITAAGIQEVKIRSVLVCESKNGVCATCYGRDLARGTPVNIGEAVGVIAAQSIGEPGTQLTMRTFHIGGAAQIADQSFIESNFEGTVRIRNRNVARNSDGDLIAMGRNVAVVIVGPDGAERAVHRLQYGARLKVDEGDQIKRGQRIAEWDPYTRPILTEVDGMVAYEDLVDGAVDDRDRRTSRPASPSASSSTGAARPARRTCVRPWSSRTRAARSPSSPRGGDARYLLPVEAIIARRSGLAR